LYEENVREISRGLPFLKDVPIVNLFVTRQEGKSSETELLIFVSPKVVK
jgi:type II secretory pathway component GspD/PulD (secretin)